MREVSPLLSLSLSICLLNLTNFISTQLMMFMKGNEKREREYRKKVEKEAMDRARKEEEVREAKRTARKLNFLITQTELYSHFVGSKIKSKLSDPYLDLVSSLCRPC